MERELINHKTLLHPNIIRFKEVFVTSTHLGIVMEYAAGGELFDRIVKAGRFSEDEARYFFQQLISGVEFCHSQVRPSCPHPGARDLLGTLRTPICDTAKGPFLIRRGHLLIRFGLVRLLVLQGVCHRDLKLENTLLDGRPAPRLKICDFGYSKSAVFDSQPKSTVGTPAYIAPEASLAFDLSLLS